MTGSRLASSVLLVAALAACGGGGGGSAPEPAVVLTSCNPVTQTGCSPGKKCTWIRVASSPTQIGALACTPAGTVDVGGTCQYGADGDTTGYDDCKGGQICKAPSGSAATGTCAQICNASDALSCSPSSEWACSTYSNYFQSGGNPAVAGICDPQCNPLTQVRLTDGAPACGSPNPAAPTLGCYGSPAGPGMPTYFTCASAGPSNMTEGVVISGTVYLNSCAPGYMPLLRQSSASTAVICSALCSPADTTSTSPSLAGGVSPYSCQDKGGGAGEECRYWWWLEDPTATATSWSNGLGFCLDYTQYMYSSVPNGPLDTQFPSCTTLSTTSFAFDPTVNDATYWGCTVH